MRTAAMPSLVPHLLATLGKDYDHTPDAGNDVGNDPQAVAPDAVLTVRTAPRRSTARLSAQLQLPGAEAPQSSALPRLRSANRVTSQGSKAACCSSVRSGG